jgi:hypothetical protein
MAANGGIPYFKLSIKTGYALGSISTFIPKWHPTQTPELLTSDEEEMELSIQYFQSTLLRTTAPPITNGGEASGV